MTPLQQEQKLVGKMTWITVNMTSLPSLDYTELLNLLQTRSQSKESLDRILGGGGVEMRSS